MRLAATEARIVRLDADGHPTGEPVVVPVKGVTLVTTAETIPTAEPQVLRWPITYTMRMRVSRHGRRMLRVWLLGRGGPWKAAHARRYRRRRR